MILSLKAEGLTLLISEQNFRFARLVADGVAIIETGHIRWIGTMADFATDTEAQRAFLHV